MTNETEGEPVETLWIDAWIRWERNENTVDDDDNDDEHSDDPPVAATDTFSFHHVLDQKPDITIQLRGFPSDSEQTWNSTGLTLWRSSQHLCDYFVKEFKSKSELSTTRTTTTTGNLFADNNRFLEVGSGLGRSGILVYHLLSRIPSSSCCGSGSNNKGRLINDRLLCLTDGDRDVLHHLRNNVERNQLAQQHNANVKLVCSQLIWGRDRALAFRQRQAGRFDVMFGSDLIYVQKVIQPLFETISTLLEDTGCFIMAHCARREGNEVNVGMVFDAADSFGLQHEVVEEDKDITVIVFRHKI